MLAVANGALRESPRNLVPPDMVQEAVAHIQAATRLVFQLMHLIVSYDIHLTRQVQYNHSICEQIVTHC